MTERCGSEIDAEIDGQYTPLQCWHRDGHDFDHEVRVWWHQDGATFGVGPVLVDEVPGGDRWTDDPRPELDAGTVDTDVPSVVEFLRGVDAAEPEAYNDPNLTHLGCKGGACKCATEWPGR